MPPNFTFPINPHSSSPAITNWRKPLILLFFPFHTIRTKDKFINIRLHFSLDPQATNTTWSLPSTYTFQTQISFNSWCTVLYSQKANPHHQSHQSPSFRPWAAKVRFRTLHCDICEYTRALWIGSSELRLTNSLVCCPLQDPTRPCSACLSSQEEQEFHEDHHFVFCCCPVS
jgi:hypothetical protein